jgi:hypothetical protein
MQSTYGLFPSNLNLTFPYYYVPTGCAPAISLGQKQ